jgi:lauroyl/myristoyl acyltransferase
MPGLKDKLADVGYGAGWSLVCRLPEQFTSRVFRFFGDLAWRREGPRVQVLEANLVRVLGPDVDGKTLRQASRAVLRNYARYWLEIFRLPVLPVDRLVDGMEEEGSRQLIFDSVASGRGVVIGIPHMGNWDQAGAWIIASGAGSFTTVMERLKPETVYERFVAFREGLGMEVLPASGGSARPFGVLAQRLRAGKIVILPCDRDVTGTGIEVDFFGEKSKMMAGPAALAVQTGACLIPAVLWFTDGGWGVNIGKEIPQPADGTRSEKIAAMMQDMARFFEDGIREHPHDWLMLQKVFVADLDPARQLAAAERAQSNGQGPQSNGQGPPPAGAVS